MKRTTKPRPVKHTGHHITSCVFKNGVECNEHTRAAVEALANAAKANAEAIQAAAKALQGGSSTMNAPMLVFE